MAFRTSSTIISLLACLGLSSTLEAQRAKMPTLDEILHRLEANLNHYDSSVPNLFCDEHVVSTMEPGPRSQNTVTDSIFRLKRTVNSDHTTILAESREIMKVDGEPPTSQKIDGPTLLNGAFEGGLAFVSFSQQACMDYTLQRVKKRHLAASYVIRFATALTAQNSASCILQEKSKGRVFIDPASMQITHLELITPRHVIIPRASVDAPAVIGERTLIVNYTPVKLGGETFWMPSSITMHAIGDANTFHPTLWSFQATYSNYRRMEVTSRILPGWKAPTQ